MCDMLAFSSPSQRRLPCLHGADSHCAGQRRRCASRRSQATSPPVDRQTNRCGSHIRCWTPSTRQCFTLFLLCGCTVSIQNIDFALTQTDLMLVFDLTLLPVTVLHAYMCLQARETLVSTAAFAVLAFGMHAAATMLPQEVQHAQQHCVVCLPACCMAVDRCVGLWPALSIEACEKEVTIGGVR